MRKASVRDLHINTSEFVREAAEGNVILIQRRGEPVAELRPVSATAGLSAAQKTKIFASMEKLWKAMPRTGDSTAIIGEDRDR
jgi:prevent-host-death family protein